jgi:hypothetical protein
MGRATAKPPPSADPAEEEDSVWGEALAAIFGIDTLTTLPADQDKPKLARKRKTAVKPD